MKIVYFDEITSTHKYLIREIKLKNLTPPVCVWSEYQTDGIGSRGNTWLGIKGNLFFSFCVEQHEFEFVPLQSLSVYFGWVFKKTLNELGSKSVMKWPNDIYLTVPEIKKIGGVITNIVDGKTVCGIGLNTKHYPSEKFGGLDIDVKNDKILNKFLEKLNQKPSWESVIKEYKEEFEKTKYIFYPDGRLCFDGSMEIKKQRIYSKR